MTERWLLLGGTFDPVHAGHLQLAVAARDRLGATVAVLAVGDAHPHRPSAALARDERVALVRAACAPVAGLLEAGEAGAPEPGLAGAARRLVAPGRELHLVFGADSAYRLARWPGARELAALATLWVVPRSGTIDTPPGVGRLDLTVAAVSSTEIRTRLAAHAPIDHLVPEGLAERISHAFQAAAGPETVPRSA